MSVEDLIVLRRFDEAAQKLEAKIKSNPRDLHARLKVAQVYTEQRKYAEAVDHYTSVADAYSQDGFHDKAVAVLAKAVKISPGDPSLAQRMSRLRQAKDREHMGQLLRQAVRECQDSSEGSLTATDFDRVWPHLATTQSIEQMPLEQLKRLLPRMQLVVCESGQVLAGEGSGDAALYLVVEGTVEAVTENPGGGTVTLRGFSTGDITGDAVLLQHRPWPATYRAAGPARLLKLTREALEQAMLGNPDPRELLNGLRLQGHDQRVFAAVKQLRAAPPQPPPES